MRISYIPTLNEVRDLSDGQFPVEIWRVSVIRPDCQAPYLDKLETVAEGQALISRRGRAMRKDTFAAALARHSRGRKVIAEREWLELRTPKARGS